jgi:CHASE2 domain-containing sensor protein
MMCRQHYNVSKGLCLACAAPKDDPEEGCIAILGGICLIGLVLLVLGLFLNSTLAWIGGIAMALSVLAFIGMAVVHAIEEEFF